MEDDRKGSIIAVYDYTPAVMVDTDDPLQRFGYVKVEGTSFTVSEPFSALEIEPIIYTYADEEQKAILRERFEVMPFFINTIRLERIFVDKVFVAEFYYERAMYLKAIKQGQQEQEVNLGRLISTLACNMPITQENIPDSRKEARLPDMSREIPQRALDFLDKF